MPKEVGASAPQRPKPYDRPQDAQSAPILQPARLELVQGPVSPGVHEATSAVQDIQSALMTTLATSVVLAGPAGAHLSILADMAVADSSAQAPFPATPLPVPGLQATLALLTERGSTGASKVDLGQSQGISSSSIDRALRELRGMGMPINCVKGRYRLEPGAAPQSGEAGPAQPIAQTPGQRRHSHANYLSYANREFTAGEVRLVFDSAGIAQMSKAGGSLRPLAPRFARAMAMLMAHPDQAASGADLVSALRTNHVNVSNTIRALAREHHLTIENIPSVGYVLKTDGQRQAPEAASAQNVAHVNTGPKADPILEALRAHRGQAVSFSDLMSMGDVSIGLAARIGALQGPGVQITKTPMGFRLVSEAGAPDNAPGVEAVPLANANEPKDGEYSFGNVRLILDSSGNSRVGTVDGPLQHLPFRQAQIMALLMDQPTKVLLHGFIERAIGTTSGGLNSALVQLRPVVSPLGVKIKSYTVHNGTGYSLAAPAEAEPPPLRAEPQATQPLPSTPADSFSVNRLARELAWPKDQMASLAMAHGWPTNQVAPKLTEYLQQRAIESGLGKLTRSNCASPAAVQFVASVLACNEREAEGLLTTGLIAYLPLP